MENHKKTYEELNEKEKEIADRIKRSGCLRCVDFAKKYNKLYNGILSNYRYILALCFPNKLKKWEDGELVLLAKKYKTKTEMMDDSYGAYQAIKRRKLEKLAFCHFEGNQLFTEESCLEIAGKYASWADLNRDNPSCVNFIRKNNLKHKLVFSVKKMKKRTIEECLDICKKYKTKEELYKNDRGVYEKIKNEKWEAVCFSFMAKNARVRQVKNLSTGEVFESLTAAATSIGRNISTLCEAIKNKTKAGGYHWVYIEEEL